MSVIHRRLVDNSIEDKIVTGLIVSSRFCRDVIPAIRNEYFLNQYAKSIIKWVVKYHKKYEAAPNQHIQDIYDKEKGKLKPEEAELISTFLQTLSDKYESESKFNADYIRDQAIEYFKKRSMELLSEEINGLITDGKVEEADNKVASYKQIAKSHSDWINPFAPKFVAKVFEDLVTEEDSSRNDLYLFKFPGKLGKTIGHFRRGHLVGVLAPMKRGKTTFLQEFAIQSLIARNKTVFISLEMDAAEISERLYRRLTATAREKQELKIPVFDCLWTQVGSCNSTNRTNKHTLYQEGEVKPEFDSKFAYRPCTFCRENDPNRYTAETWYELHKTDQLSLAIAQKYLTSFTKFYGDKFRFKSYPPYEGSISAIRAYLDSLEYNEDFIPDVIIIDYADVLAPEDKNLSMRDRLNEIWQYLKNLAMKRHCLVVTASQSNRGSMEKKHISAADIAEDIRKTAHVDTMLFLNQSDKEKEYGIMRIGFFFRHKFFANSQQVQILQQLDTAQVILDTEMYYE